VLLQAQPTVIPHRYPAINYIDATGSAMNAALERLLRTLGVANVEEDPPRMEQGRESPIDARR
jgi:hypothetical protein